MKRLITTVVVFLSFAWHLSAGERTTLARMTVYWPEEGSGKSAAWNGAGLSEDHCAVDPKKIPYGSKVIFDGGECKATDTGPDVVKRKAARAAGRTAEERNALVIDRFFDTKQRALAWASAHPPFMIVRVQTAETKTPRTSTEISAIQSFQDEESQHAGITDLARRFDAVDRFLQSPVW